MWAFPACRIDVCLICGDFLLGTVLVSSSLTLLLLSIAVFGKTKWSVFVTAVKVQSEFIP